MVIPGEQGKQDAHPNSLVASLHGVGKVYHPGSPGEVIALADIDLEVAPGESIALVGPSGCGKSTLLHILGLLDRPTTGTVTVAGIDVLQVNRRALPPLRNRTIGFVFQHHHLLPTLTAAENVAVPLRYRGMSRSQALTAATGWLERVGLAHRRDHLPAELSGGERQRVAVARALACEPSLLLADEPTGELDSTNAAKLIDLLCSLNQQLGQTLIVATHDPHVASGCRRLLAMKDGRIVDDRIG